MDDLDQMPDVDEAWQQFAQQHISSVRLMHTWRKVAAILIGILAISGITIAAVRIVHQAQHEEQPAVVVEESQSAVSVSQVLPADTIVRTEPVVFDNVTLDSIAKDIAAYHHLDMDLQNEQVSQLRFYFVWNRDDNLQEVLSPCAVSSMSRHRRLLATMIMLRCLRLCVTSTSCHLITTSASCTMSWKTSA